MLAITQKIETTPFAHVSPISGNAQSLLEVIKEHLTVLLVGLLVDVPEGSLYNSAAKRCRTGGEEMVNTFVSIRLFPFQMIIHISILRIRRRLGGQNHPTITNNDEDGVIRTMSNKKAGSNVPANVRCSL